MNDQSESSVETAEAFRRVKAFMVYRNAVSEGDDR